MAVALWEEVASVQLPPQLILLAREDSTVGRVATVCPLTQLGASLFSVLGARGTSTLLECSASSTGVPRTWISWCHHTIKRPSETCPLCSSVPSCTLSD